jgi:hypothetical protein
MPQFISDIFFLNKKHTVLMPHGHIVAFVGGNTALKYTIM